MNKVRVPVSCCYIGDILADDVNNDRSTTLVRKDTMATVIVLFVDVSQAIFNIKYMRQFKQDYCTISAK